MNWLTSSTTTAMPPPESKPHSGDASGTSSPKKHSSRSTSPEGLRPALPPRPSESLLTLPRPSTSHGTRPSIRGSLLSGVTTAVSMTDVNSYVNSYTSPDGSRGLQNTSPKKAPSSRVASGKTSETGEDSMSIRSYIPNLQGSQEVESLFGDGIGGHQIAGPWDPSRRESHLMEEDSGVDFSTEFDDIPGDDQGEQALAVWKAKKKHFIIISAAGKPIYTRHGTYNIISSYVGIIQTILAFYQSSSDPLRSFSAGGARFVILSQTNLFLVAISSLLESDAQLRLQLDALYMQILSSLTLPTLTHIFSVRPSTDLRRPLEGTEVLLSALADSFTRGSPSTLLSALECLKIRKSHRSVINSTLIKARVDDLLYGLVVAGGRLVSVIRPKKHSLHPGDLQLIFNMLFEAEGIKAGGGDSWIPVCLPGFNNKGYLYMYVSFLDLSDTTVREADDGEEIAKEDAVAIILLSANKESFESLRSMKSYLVAELRRNGSLRIVQTAVRTGRPSASDIVPGGVLRHFLYKSKGNVQFCMPSFSPHYESLDQRRSLLSMYHGLHASVHAKHATVKVHHSVSGSASALAWITPMFELYCITSPYTSRNALAQGANKVVQWVQREEERIFIIGGAVF